MSSTGLDKMNITFYTKHFHPSSGTQEVLRKKFRRLSRFHGRILHMAISIGKEPYGAYEMTLRIGVPNKQELIFRDFGPSLYALMDIIYDKAETSLTRANQKKTTSRALVMV